MYTVVAVDVNGGIEECVGLSLHGALFELESRRENEGGTWTLDV